MLSKTVYSSNVSLKRSFTMFRLPYSYLRRISPTIEREGLKGLRGQNGHKFLLPRSRRLRHWRSSIPLRRSSSSSSPSSSSAAASRESCSLPSPPPFSNTDTVVARSPPPTFACNETIGRTKRPRYPRIGLLRFANGRDRTTTDTDQRPTRPC